MGGPSGISGSPTTPLAPLPGGPAAAAPQSAPPVAPKLGTDTLRLGGGEGPTPAVSQSAPQDAQARETLGLASALPPRAEMKYRSFEKQDAYERSLLTENLTRDPKIMSAMKNWSQLEPGQKLEVARVAAERQAAIYGFTAVPMAHNPDLPGKNYGNYLPASQRIELGNAAMEDGAMMLGLVAHEQSHAYQAQVEGQLARGELKAGDRLFKQAQVWTHNEDHYIISPNPGRSNPPLYRKYREQPVEAHAFATGDAVQAAVLQQLKREGK